MAYLLFVYSYLSFPALFAGILYQIPLLMALYWGYLRRWIPSPINNSKVSGALAKSVALLIAAALIHLILRTGVNSFVSTFSGFFFSTPDSYHLFAEALEQAPPRHPLALGATLLLLFPADGTVLYFLHRHWALCFLPLNADQKHQLALLTTIATIPVLVLVPYSTYLTFYNPLY